MKYRFDEVYGSSGDRARLLALQDALTAEGRGPETIRFFTAPGRTELGGNHTDQDRKSTRLNSSH